MPFARAALLAFGSRFVRAAGSFCCATAAALHPSATPFPGFDFSTFPPSARRGRRGRLRKRDFQLGQLIRLIGRQIPHRRVQHPTAQQQRANAKRYVHDFNSSTSPVAPGRCRNARIVRHPCTRIIRLFHLGNNSPARLKPEPRTTFATRLPIFRGIFQPSSPPRRSGKLDLFPFPLVRTEFGCIRGRGFPQLRARGGAQRADARADARSGPSSWSANCSPRPCCPGHKHPIARHDLVVRRRRAAAGDRCVIDRHDLLAAESARRRPRHPDRRARNLRQAVDRAQGVQSPCRCR